MTTTTPAAKRTEPSDAVIEKALSAIQGTSPETFPSTDRKISAKYARDHSFVIVRVERDMNYESGMINKTYPAKMSLVRIRSRAMRATTKLVRALTTLTTCETTKIFISRDLMIAPTHYSCEESRHTKPSPSLARRDAVIQCYVQKLRTQGE